MSELIFKQNWQLTGDGPMLPQVGPLPSGMEDRPFYAHLHVECDEGTELLHVFKSPDTEKIYIDVPDGTTCYIEHNIEDSSFETQSSCGYKKIVMGPDKCSFNSVRFDESIPMLNPISLVILAVGVSMLAWSFFSRKEDQNA